MPTSSNPGKTATNAAAGDPPAPLLAMPADELQERVVRLFAELLRRESIGPDDGFFELGGDSLLAVDAALRLEEMLGRSFAVADLLEAPTPRGLVERLRASGARSKPGLVLLREGDGRPPLILVPGGLGDGEDLVVCARIVEGLDPGQGVLVLADDGAEELDGAGLVASSFRRLLQARPEGPYRLVGVCIGGILAHALATALEAEGRAVSFLALVDAPFPNRLRRLRQRLGWLREPWGDNLGRRIRFHFRVARQETTGRLTYLLEKARVASGAVRSLGDPERRRVVQRRAWRVRSLLSLTPARFGGPLHFVESEEGNRERLAEEWRSSAGRLEVAVVPGDHHSYIREHADDVARRLRDWLESSGAIGRS